MFSSFDSTGSEASGPGENEDAVTSAVQTGTTQAVNAFNELGPFSPPRDFAHGEEFSAPVPRPIPAVLRHGSHGQRRRGKIYSLIALGLMFIVFWPIPFVQGLSFYILPLKYLHWIGLGLIGIGVWSALAGILTSGRYRLVKEGNPLVARVIDCQPVESGTKEAPTFFHVARVEFQHPETSEHVVFDLPELDYWPVAKREQISCVLKPGDYVTVVHLPWTKDSSFALYGFQGLNPECEYILQNGRPIRGTSPFSAVMIAFLVAFIVLLFMAGFDVLMFSFPISGDWKLPVAIAVGGFLLGGLLGVVTWKRSRSTEKSKGPLASFLGSGFVGAFAGPIGFFILNTRLDSLPTELKPVSIINFWETTHNFVIRDYEVEYKELVNGENRKQHLRFSQVARLYGSEYGVAEVSPGRFGYPWIKGIHPVNWLVVGDAVDVEGRVYNITLAAEPQVNGEQEEYVTRMKPVIALDDQQFAPIPEELLQLEIDFLKKQPGILSIEPEQE